jgi:uncharacterized protein
LRLRVSSWLPFPAEQVYAWHLRPGAFGRLVPPWEWVRTSDAEEPLTEGSLRRLQVSPFRVPWLARHDQFVPGRSFRDVQERGPFRSWEHRHVFEPDGNNASWLIDEIHFQLPLGAALPGFVRAQLESMFCFRHAATARDLQAAARLARPLRVAISGSHGVLGSALRSLLLVSGCQVQRLVRRRPTGADEVWLQDLSALEGSDAVVHLAARALNDGNFGARHRREAWVSRVEGTQQLVAGLRQLRRPPVLLTASGIGYYGSGDASRPATESAPAGSGFLAELCQAWEAAARGLSSRTVRLRIGPVLTLRGGILPPFYWSTRLGPGLVFGSGEQGVSWIAEADMLRLLVEALVREDWHGPLNVVAPAPCSMREFVRAVAGRRPLLRVPAPLTRAFLRGRAELVLQGTYAVPALALEAGLPFVHPQLRLALAAATGHDVPTLDSSFSLEWSVR